MTENQPANEEISNEIPDNKNSLNSADSVSDLPTASVKNEAAQQKSFWRLDDGGWIKFALTIVPILWGFYQFFSQQNADHAKILETYFSSLQSLENDILRYVLSSQKGTLTDEEKKEDKETRDEAAKVIQSLAIAKTLIALESLDPVRKGKIIEYLHNSKLISKTHSDYDSNNLLKQEISTNKKEKLCKKLTEDPSSIPFKKIDISSQDISPQKGSRINIKGVNLSKDNISLVGIHFVDNGLSDFNFNKTNLDCSSFKNSSIKDTSFRHTQLRGSDFSGAIFTGIVDFTGANLIGADFTNTNIPKNEHSINRVNFQNTIFIGAKIPKNIQYACNWEKASYIGDKSTGKISEVDEVKNKRFKELVKNYSDKDYKDFVENNKDFVENNKDLFAQLNKDKESPKKHLGCALVNIQSWWSDLDLIEIIQGVKKPLYKL